MTPHGMMSWFECTVVNEDTVARAVAVMVTPMNPKTRVK